MLFSVTFSYVTLQSELTQRIRPAEAQRQLLDLTRQVVSDLDRQLTAADRQHRQLEVSLGGWLEMERGHGWATRTCEAEDHCYLAAVCQRIRRRIAAWEARSGRSYREGPGEALIFGALQAELSTLQKVGERLASYRHRLESDDGALAVGLDNRQRLDRLDQLVGRLPEDDLAAVSCQATALPLLPAYDDHARDVASTDEQPVYAWLDLQTLWHSEEPIGRQDYPTIFALALAFFVDLFVLAVALGAAGIGHSAGRGLPVLQGVERDWHQQALADLEAWLEVALGPDQQQPAGRRQLLESLLDEISFDRQGRPRWVPNGEHQRRFAHLLVACRAAKPRILTRLGRSGSCFDLEEWVLPALAQAAQRWR